MSTQENSTVNSIHEEAKLGNPTVHIEQLIDHAAEKRVRVKTDIHLMPVLCLLLILAFLDRINIGNARIQGLEADLHMHGSDYNVALLIFFIPYIILEIPSNIIMKKVRPSLWLCGLMVCWGIYNLSIDTFQTYDRPNLLTWSLLPRYHYSLPGSYQKLRWACSLSILTWSL